MMLLELKKKTTSNWFCWNKN